LRTWQHLKAYHSIQAWFPFVFGCSKNRHIIVKMYNMLMYDTFVY
jgi:hypothetical protein